MEKEHRNITIVEENARDIRIDNGLTQKEFGEILGISKSYVSDIENGYTGLSIEQINTICNYADVSFDYMFGFMSHVDPEVIKIEKINLKILGSHLKEIRTKELNMSQEALAQELSIHRTMITYCEAGKKTISTACLKQICELSGYSADYCVGKLNQNKRIKQTKKIKAKEYKELIGA